MGLLFHGAGLLLIFLSALGFVGWVWARRLKQVPATLDDLKLLLIYFVLIILGILALAVALGDVRQETSYGLNELLIALTGFASAAVGWAFGSRGANKE